MYDDMMRRFEWGVEWMPTIVVELLLISGWNDHSLQRSGLVGNNISSQSYQWKQLDVIYQ